MNHEADNLGSQNHGEYFKSFSDIRGQSRKSKKY